MKGLSVAGVVVGLLALFIASAALVSTPKGDGDVKAELGKLKAEFAELGPELRTVKKHFAMVPSDPDEASARVEELTAQLARMSDKIERLDRAVDE